MKRIILIFFLFWGIFSAVSAQNRLIDSLRTQLAQTQDQKRQVDLLNELAFRYLYISNDSTLLFTQRAEDIAQKIAYLSGVVNARIRRGNAYQTRADLAKTLENYQLALNLAEEIKDSVSVARVTGNLGLLYSSMQNYYRALQYYEQGLALQRRFGNIERIATNLTNIGNTYIRLGNLEKAEQYTWEAYQTSQKCHDLTTQMVCMRNLADLRELQGKEEETEQLLSKTFSAIEELGNQRDKSLVLIIQARLRLRQNRLKEAENAALEAFQIAHSLKYREQLFRAFDILHKVYAAQEQFDKAYQYQKLTNIYRDSIVNAVNLSVANTFEFEKKQNEIHLINQQRALEKAENERQKIFNYALLGFVVLLGLMAFNFFRQKSKEKQSKQILAEKNDEISEILVQVNLQKNDIERKNEAITASIQYAKRIQTAMLPFRDRFEEAFGKDQFFIFFKPRDIVSGDFYFLEQSENYTFLAVADCTGHGVPGAFMSMISTQLLHEIIKGGTEQPHEILNTLHHEIRRVLQQESSKAKDGLDIALMRLEPATKMLTFSGAKNPLWYFDLAEKTAILQELSATRLAIGGEMINENIQFDLHSLSIENPKMIYLFSDGFQDQFGGENNRKFSSRNLKNLFSQIYQNSVSEQVTILENTFQTWKGTQKQIDDILVIGLKIL